MKKSYAITICVIILATCSVACNNRTTTGNPVAGFPERDQSPQVRLNIGVVGGFYDVGPSGTNYEIRIFSVLLEDNTSKIQWITPKLNQVSLETVFGNTYYIVNLAPGEIGLVFEKSSDASIVGMRPKKDGEILFFYPENNEARMDFLHFGTLEFEYDLPSHKTQASVRRHVQIKFPVKIDTQETNWYKQVQYRTYTR